MFSICLLRPDHRTVSRALWRHSKILNKGMTERLVLSLFSRDLFGLCCDARSPGQESSSVIGQLNLGLQYRIICILHHMAGEVVIRLVFAHYLVDYQCFLSHVHIQVFGQLAPEKVSAMNKYFPGCERGISHAQVVAFEGISVRSVLVMDLGTFWR